MWIQPIEMLIEASDTEPLDAEPLDMEGLLYF